LEEAGLFSNEIADFMNIMPMKSEKARKSLFGKQSNNVFVLQGMDLLNTYLNQQCSLLTFVKPKERYDPSVRRERAVVDGLEMKSTTAGQVIGTAFDSGYYGVLPDFVPSGLRIFLGPTYFRYVHPMGKMCTIFHEITHKVLGTDDRIGYDHGQCQLYATIDPKKAMTNATNWELVFFDTYKASGGKYS
jgi:hypothetical protein